MELRSKRMAPILRIAETKEREAAKLLAQAENQLQTVKAQIIELESYKQEYRIKLQQAGSQGMTGESLGAFRRFMENVDVVIARHHARLPAYQKQIDQALAAWQVVNIRYQALKKLVERYKHGEIAERDRAEQRELDDLVRRKPLGGK